MNTKPHQGRGFMIFRSNLMGIKINYNQECHRKDWEQIQVTKESENKALLVALAKAGIPMKTAAMTKPSPQEYVDSSANKENLPTNVDHCQKYIFTYISLGDTYEVLRTSHY